MLLGEVIQAITDMRLNDFVNSEIVKPLELRTLTYGPVTNDKTVIQTEFGNQTERKCVPNAILPSMVGEISIKP